MFIDIELMDHAVISIILFFETVFCNLPPTARVSGCHLVFVFLSREPTAIVLYLCLYMLNVYQQLLYCILILVRNALL